MKKIRIIVSVLVLVVFTYSTALAQERASSKRPTKEHKEEYKKAEQEYIVVKMDLSDKDREKLMSFLNKHSSNMKDIRRSSRENYEGKEEKEALSDKEVILNVEKHMDIKEKAMQLDRDFHQQLKENFTSSQVASYYRAKKAYRKEYKDDYEHRH